MSIKEKQDRLPTLYWLPILHKRPYKARFIANSSSCTTTNLSKLLTSCLTAVKKHWIRYYDTVYERDGINYFWSIKNSNDVLNKVKSKNFSVLRVASGPRVKLASCKSALNPPMVCSTDRSKAVVPVLVLLFVALWFILRGDLLYVFPCVILFLCFSVLLVLRLPRLGKRELILVLFVRLFGLCLFRFVSFSSSWGLGRAAVCDCGTPWAFLLPFFSKLSTYDFFSTLYTTLPHHLIKDELIDLINRTFIRENTQYLTCNEECAFFTSNIILISSNIFSLIIITIYGRVKKSVMPLFIFWIIFLLDLELNFIGKLLVFRWELSVLLLLQICFFFVMREIS